MLSPSTAGPPSPFPAAPAAGVTADAFSVRWTGQFPFVAGPYTVAASADDGIKLWLDNVVAVDRWTNTTASSVTRTMTAGNHDVKVEYYENAGGASARFRWDAN